MAESGIMGSSVPYANQQMPETLVERVRCQGGSEKLDLSLCNIVKVPLQVIRENYEGQVMQLDLSYNAISFVGPKFTLDMIHITKLDLSKNKIQWLPDNFGMMQDLVYLDLHRNQLANLPVSMGNMQRLRFLRISENPFRAPLKDFLGTKEPGISAVALAGLVVQFLKEFAEAHGTVDPTISQGVVPGTLSSRVHYRSRSQRMGPDGESSASSFGSGGGAVSNNDIPEEQKSDRKAFQWALFGFFKWASYVAIWFFLTAILAAYFMETSFLDDKAGRNSYFATFWRYYKWVHEISTELITPLPKLSLITWKGPEAVEGWRLYRAMVAVKDFSVDTFVSLGAWLRIINPPGNN